MPGLPQNPSAQDAVIPEKESKAEEKGGGPSQGRETTAGRNSGLESRSMATDSDVRQAVRQIELFLRDGERTRLIVALAILDPTESNHLCPNCRHVGHVGRCDADIDDEHRCPCGRETSPHDTNGAWATWDGDGVGP